MKKIANAISSGIAKNLSKERARILINGIDLDEAGSERIEKELKEFNEKPSTIIQKMVLEKLDDCQNSLTK